MVELLRPFSQHGLIESMNHSEYFKMIFIYVTLSAKIQKSENNIDKCLDNVSKKTIKTGVIFCF